MSEYIISNEQLGLIWDFATVCVEGEKLPRIVRCRDCKHYTDDEVEYRNYCNEWCGQVKPDGFCAWGERQEQ